MEIVRYARPYIRVSSATQAEDGISLETQQKLIEQYCEFKKIKIIKFYIDAGLSGKDMNRPALISLMDDLQKSESVIVCDISRISRRILDTMILLEKIKNKHAYFVCLNPDLDMSTPLGEAMMVMLMTIAQLERSNISQHVSKNMRQLSKDGRLRARSVYGYKFVGKDKDMEPVPEQQRVIEKIIMMYNNGENLYNITKRLNEDGDNISLALNKKTVKNEEQIFYIQTVKRILADHGLIDYKEVKIKKNPHGEDEKIENVRKPVEQRIKTFNPKTN
jgi:site-specific DNA recombinase